MSTAVANSMRFRLTALVRKAGVKSDAECEEFLEFLVKTLQNKKDYEAALGSEEGAELFIKRHGIKGEKERIFLAMQVRELGAGGGTWSNESAVQSAASEHVS
jgi:hypothetical protein